MFSVVIPLFNKADYIQKAVGSVLDQSYTDFELIIVDDGSTDDGAGRLASFSDPRLRVIRQENRGVSAARNRGFAGAKYDLIAFLDADDWWDSSFLEEMSKLVQKCPEAHLFGTSYFIVKNGNKVPANIGVEQDFESGYIAYFNVYSKTFWVPINCSFVVVKKGAFGLVGGFNPELRFGEDLDLWLRLALKFRVAYVNKNLAFSNQDVVLSDRALGARKVWLKSEHVLFNLGYLLEEEKTNSDLKFLLDGIRLRGLMYFYLESRLIKETSALLKATDFTGQPSFFRFVYHSPKWIVRGFFQMKEVGSRVKQMIIEILNNTHF